tara:strand:- start:214 stop:345 length:132 start_codon:yes stop_codon:yes gene_type:complete
MNASDSILGMIVNTSEINLVQKLKPSIIQNQLSENKNNEATIK